jgi:hypothetical protein
MTKGSFSLSAIPSFPLLIHTLADKYHRGCLLTMSQATDIPYTTLWRWEKGMARQYGLTVIEQLIAYYQFDRRQLWDLILNDSRKRASGQRVSTADLSHRKRGPSPGRAKRVP